jgi:hypothetical protein
MSAVDIGDIRKEGFVLKESAIIRQYRKRWLVLTRTHLYTFKKDRSYAEATEAVDLKACGTVKSADDITNKAFSFTVQVPERNFFFACANDKERNEWVAAIGRATTESRRVRSYSEEVEYREQQRRETSEERARSPAPAAARAGLATAAYTGAAAYASGAYAALSTAGAGGRFATGAPPTSAPPTDAPLPFGAAQPAVLPAAAPALAQLPLPASAPLPSWAESIVTQPAALVGAQPSGLAGLQSFVPPSAPPPPPPTMQAPPPPTAPPVLAFQTPLAGLQGGLAGLPPLQGLAGLPPLAGMPTQPPQPE